MLTRMSRLQPEASFVRLCKRRVCGTLILNCLANTPLCAMRARATIPRWPIGCLQRRLRFIGESWGDERVKAPLPSVRIARVGVGRFVRVRDTGVRRYLHRCSPALDFL